MGWSTDIATTDDMRVKLHDADYKYAKYTEVVEAVNERCNAAGIATLDVPVRLDLWPQIRISVDEKVDALFSLYANHTDNSGNWNGQATIPAWTESDILASISATRIPATVSCDIPSWLNQQYKIINLLRWISVSSFSGLRYSKTSNNSTNPGWTWTDIVNDWTSKAFTGPDSFAIQADKQKDGSDWRIGAVQEQLDYSTPSSFQFSYDFYYYWQNVTSYLFYPTDNLTQDQKLNLAKSGGETTSISFRFPDDGEFTPTVLSEPGAGERYISTANATPNLSYPGDPFRYLVCKFTGANGFTYKDW